MSDGAHRGHPLLQLTVARLLEQVRHPSALFWVFGFPILLALALGIAFQEKGSEPARAALVAGNDKDEALRKTLDADERLDVASLTEQDAAQALKKGRVDIVIAPGDEGVVLRFDPTKPSSREVRLLVNDALQRASGRVDPLPVFDDHAAAPGARYIDFLLPGLVGLNIMGSCLWGVGYAVVDARRRRVLKSFAATPMRRTHYLLSFLLSRMVMLFLQMTALLFAGWLLFDVVNQGAHVTLAIVALTGSYGFLGISLTVAARVERAESAQGWMNLVSLPMWVLSGSFFDPHRFPEIFHPIIDVLPLTALNNGLRAVMNESAGLLDLGFPFLILATWGTIGFVVALKLFRWQ